MVHKVQLHDCCGAQHIYEFPNSPGYNMTIRIANRGRLWDNKPVYLPAEVALELMCKPTGYHDVPGHEGWVYHATNPGIITCILPTYKDVHWAPVLRRLGWVCVVNNVRNRNSNNRLYLWTKITNPNSRVARVGRFQDGTPYTGRIRRLPNGSGYSRARHPVTGRLETLEVTEGTDTSQIMVVG